MLARTAADETQARSAVHRARQRRQLRPLGIALLAVVAVPTLTTAPRPRLHGTGLAVLAGLALWIGAGALSMSRPVAGRVRLASLDGALVVLLAVAVALLAFTQPNGAAALGLSLVAFDAAASVALPVAIALTAAATLATDVAVARSAIHVAATVAATTLLAALMFLVAVLLRTSREEQARAEALAAALAEAQEDRARAAAEAERARIARDLHDVLAHTLSGLSLQLEATRLLARRDCAGGELERALERSATLAREGLGEARRAVGTLRGDAPPGVAQIDGLVEAFAADTAVPVALAVEGAPRPLGAEAGVALFRAAQEALVNVARHSRARRVDVRVVYAADAVRLVVDDGDPAPDGRPALPDAGSGYGLQAMRERVEKLGGTVRAGPTAEGFRVEVEVPA